MIYRVRRNVVNLRHLNVKFIPHLFNSKTSIVTGSLFQGMTIRARGVGQSAEDFTDLVERYCFLHLDSELLELTNSIDQWQKKVRTGNFEFVRDQMKIMIPFAQADLINTEYLDLIQIRVLTKLLDHQVKGEEIVKGLKALSIDIPNLKIQESYLGGWNIQIDGVTCTAGRLIEEVGKKR